MTPCEKSWSPEEESEDIFVEPYDEILFEDKPLESQDETLEVPESCSETHVEPYHEILFEDRPLESQDEMLEVPESCSETQGLSVLDCLSLCAPASSEVGQDSEVVLSEVLLQQTERRTRAGRVYLPLEHEPALSSIMSRYAKQQDVLKKQVSNFVQAQQRHLEQHRRSFEVHMHSQRAHMTAHVRSALEDPVSCSKHSREVSPPREVSPERVDNSCDRHARFCIAEKRSSPENSDQIHMLGSGNYESLLEYQPKLEWEMSLDSFQEHPEDRSANGSLPLRPSVLSSGPITSSWASRHVGNFHRKLAESRQKHERSSRVAEEPTVHGTRASFFGGGRPTRRQSRKVKDGEISGFEHHRHNHWSRGLSSEERANRLKQAYEDVVDVFRDPEEPKTPFGRISKRVTEGGIHIHETVLSIHCLDLEELERVVNGKHFKMCVSVLILFNALFIGVTSDLAVRSAIRVHDAQSGDFNEIDSALWSVILETIFNLLFAVELVMRVVALEGRFCGGEDWKWNIFDGAIVTFSVFETFLLFAGFSPNYVRLLRLARVVRSLRMLRLIRFSSLVRKLRVLTLAIVNCSSMLMWAVLVLILVMFLFSVVFLTAVSSYIGDAGPTDVFVNDLKIYFSSLPMTMLTLFMSVSGGIDWWVVAQLLLEISTFYAAIFMVFVVIMVLAMLNVINAIFVNDAMETTRMDVELRMQAEFEETKFMLERLTGIWESMTSERDSFQLDLEGFLAQVERDDVKLQFALVGVHFSDGVTLFKLLNVREDGELGIDEFVMGCLRLKGGGILMDLDISIKETKKLLISTLQDLSRVLDKF